MLIYKVRKYFSKHPYYWLFSFLIFVYILLRGFFVPLAHDETATFFHYVIVGDFLPYSSLFEANNHFLNTLLTYISYRLFGNAEIALRIPNIISFWIYAYFVLKLSFHINKKWIRSMMQIALLTTISLVEFFSLSRGYGLSMAFFMGWLYFASRFVQCPKPSNQLLLWLLAILALISNLALFNSFLLSIAVVLYVTLCDDISRNNVVNISILILTALPIVILSSIYAFDLKEHGALYLGSLSGFAEVTIHSLLRMEFNVYNINLSYLVGLMVLLFALFIISKSFKATHHFLSFKGLIVFLLLGNTAGAILLALFFKVNYPEDRAGLFFIPLTIILIGIISDLFASEKHILKYISILLLIFPFNLFANLNLHSVGLWKGEAIKEKLFESLLGQKENPEGPTSIAGYSIFQLNFAYHNLNHGSPFSWMSTNAYPNSTADYNFLRKKELDSLQNWYKVIYAQEFNDIYLAKRKEFCKRVLMLDTMINSIAEQHTGEYFDLLRLNTKFFEGKDILVQIPLKFNSFSQPMQCNLVFSASDSVGNMLLYEWMPLHWINPVWKDDKFTMVRSIPDFPKNAKELVIYVWNTGEVKYSGGANSIQIFALTD